MKTYIATYYRHNPQLSNGGYQTTRKIEAVSITSARKKAREITGAPVVIKKEPVPRISENGREMLALYEKLSERDQLLLLGRLQEMASPMLGDSREKNQKDDARSAAG